MHHKDERIIERLLEITKQDIVPLTQAGVQQGNKLFGAAILRKDDLSLVIAETNNEIQNPLWHGEVHAMKKLYEMPASKRPSPKDCIFFATHEPCPLCLSAITWGGYDNFYYLFSYTDSRDAFNIPHDLRILKEVFKCDDGKYAHENYYWNSYDLQQLIKQCEVSDKQRFQQQVDELKGIYDEMSDIYQQSKLDNDIPLG
ncbi:Guanine deaminase [Legionella nautarum]|uniref:Guanine deaminase n=1 Tax=Legionella nautarum TaxID=45070 RepID=A0A0W0WKW1_9GAMM|nr:nucleoside deaminase [Legionella nautarum]KTD32964.1 Guanine deaminase [Legionella nautarum]